MEDDIDPRLLREAADWLVRQQTEPGDAGWRAEFDHWRTRSAAHAAAWRRAEAVMHDFQQAPAGLTRRALAGVREQRRRALRALGALTLAAPGAWLLWRQAETDGWRADQRTTVGEQRTLTLADGSRLILNTASAVDIRFDLHARRVRLWRGEVLIDTAHDTASPARPFWVDTHAGRLRALGTRFAVRLVDDQIHLTVYAGAVEITPTQDTARVVDAGETAWFGATHIHPPLPLADPQAWWAEGMLVAQDMTLADWVAELSRYRPGVLRCDPAVAHWRVSGAFPLTDTDASLALLTHTRPLRLRSLTRYWVSLEAVGPADAPS